MNRKNSSIVFLSFTCLILIVCLAILPVFSLEHNTTVTSYGTVNYLTSRLSRLHVDGKYLRDSSGNRVILRGVNYDDGQWDNPPLSEQQFVYMKNWGCNSVYICIGWWGLPGTYDSSTFWSNLDNVMAWTEKQGLYVVYKGFAMAGHSLESVGYTWSTWIDEWKTIANRYKNYSHILYEPISEYLHTPYSTYQNQMLAVIDAIRTIDPDAIIVVQSMSDASWPDTFEFMLSHPISRSNIVFSHDSYGFHTYPGNSQSVIRSYLSSHNMKWLLDNGYCVIASEFGGDLHHNQDWSSWDVTWLNNFMTVMDEDGYSGYGAWRWMVFSRSDYPLLLADSSGNPTAYGITLRDYYMAH